MPQAETNRAPVAATSGGPVQSHRLTGGAISGQESQRFMKNMRLIARGCGLGSLLFAVALFSGCASADTETASPIPAAPVPPGKARVCIHCPTTSVYMKLPTEVWDGTNFVVELGNGHSLAYDCAPGEHYFINLSVEITGCVEANLQAGQTYDLWVDTYRGMFVASKKIKPVHQDKKGQRLVAKWTRKDSWIDPTPLAAPADPGKLEKLQQLIQEFSSGSRREKLQHLAPEDHR
jgi:hypothetical protein